MQNKKSEYYSQSGLAKIFGTSRQLVQRLCRDKFKPAMNKEGEIDLWHPVVQKHKTTLDEKRAAVADPFVIAEREAAKKASKKKKKKKVVKKPVRKPVKKVAKKKVVKRPVKKPGKKPAKKPVKKKPVKKVEPVEEVTEELEEEQKSTPIVSMEVSIEDIENLTIREVVGTYGGITGFKSYVDTLAKMSDWKAKETKYLKERRKLVDINFAKTLFSLIDLSYREVLEVPDRIADQIIAIAHSKKKTHRIEIIDLMRDTLSRILKGTKDEVLKDLKNIENE